MKGEKQVYLMTYLGNIGSTEWCCHQKEMHTAWVGIWFCLYLFMNFPFIFPNSYVNPFSSKSFTSGTDVNQLSPDMFLLLTKHGLHNSIVT